MAATLVSGVAVVAALTELRDVLAAVVDPEIPVLTIADLGILRDITGAGGSEVIVTITPTYSRCYAGGGGGYSTAHSSAAVTRYSLTSRHRSRMSQSCS